MVPRVAPGLVRCSSLSSLSCSVAVAPSARRELRWATLAETEVQNFGVAALGDEEIGGLDVAMDDAGFVCGIEGVGDFDGEREDGVEIERALGDAMLQRLAIEKFHGDEGLAVLVVNFVDGADVGMVQGGGGFGFALEAGEGLRVFGDFVGEEFQGHEAG